MTNIKHLGTQYGGWVIDLDDISDGDTIISGGVGEDISFEEELLKLKDVKIICVDPTSKSHEFMETKNNPKIKLIKKAIESDDVDTITMYKNTNPNYVSESSSNNHDMVGVDSYEVETISIKELVNEYTPKLIKIDIEGSEYNVYKDCLGVNQICIEFHHHCIDNIGFDKTQEVIDFFTSNGYGIIDNRRNIEITFSKNKIK